MGQRGRLNAILIQPIHPLRLLFYRSVYPKNADIGIPPQFRVGWVERINPNTCQLKKTGVAPYTHYRKENE